MGVVRHVEANPGQRCSGCRLCPALGHAPCFSRTKGWGVGEQVSRVCGCWRPCWRPSGGGAETQASGAVGVDDQPANVSLQSPDQAKARCFGQLAALVAWPDLG